MDRFSHARRTELTDAVNEAYHWARIDVYDTLPAGATINTGTLSRYQRKAIDRLTFAEGELESFRNARRASTANSAPSLSLVDAG